MFKVHRAGSKHENEKVQLARKRAEEFDWRHIYPRWDALIQRAVQREDVIQIGEVKVERI